MNKIFGLIVLSAGALFLASLAQAQGHPAYGKYIDYNWNENASDQNRALFEHGLKLIKDRDTSEEAISVFKKIATKPDASLFERSAAYSLIGSTLAYHWYPDKDTETQNKHRAIEAYELAISTGGLTQENVKYLEWRIDTLLAKLGLAKRYYKPPTEAERIVTVIAEIPKKFANGSYSGYCGVNFDLSDDGIPTRIWLSFCTNDLLEEPTLEAVKQWRYEPIDPSNPEIVRTFIRERVAFNIYDENGDLLPRPWPSPKELDKRHDRYLKRYRKLKKKWEKEAE